MCSSDLNLISSRFSMSLMSSVVSREISSSMKLPKASVSSSFSRSFGVSMKMPSMSKMSGMPRSSNISSWSSFFGGYPSFSPPSPSKSGWSDGPSPPSPSSIIPSFSISSLVGNDGYPSLSKSLSRSLSSGSYSYYPSLSPFLYGGGGEWADEWYYGKKKRYRRTKTFDPLEELFGM